MLRIMLIMGTYSEKQNRVGPCRSLPDSLAKKTYTNITMKWVFCSENIELHEGPFAGCH